VPLYEYRCERCGERFEVLQRLGAGPDGLGCPGCGWSGLEREASSFSGGGGSSGRGCAPRGGFT
jgi:putative FmdB family regulatory protein